MTDPTLPSAELNQKLAQLRADYLVRLYVQADEMQSLGRGLLRQEWEAEGAQQLYMLAHKLAGSAGSFGFHALSQAARQLEQMLLPYVSGAAPAWGEPRALLDRVLSDVARLAGRAGGRPEVHSMSRPDPSPSGKSVFVVEDDTHLAQFIGARLNGAGYVVKLFKSLRELDRAGDVPCAVVMDVVLPEGESAGLQAIMRLRREQGSVPVVVISVRDDAQARLAALRAGAARYLTKPLDLERLVDILDGLLGRSQAAPIRVLLVDDDQDLLAHSAAVLEAANMHVRTVYRPMDALEAARNFSPDVIVVDVYMPEVGGMELAALLRQDDAFAQTPILFLSGEADISKQLLALDLGGDEFLVKPVAPDHLVAAIRARGKRSRHMQRLILDMRRVLAEKETGQFALDQHAIVSVADAVGNILYANQKFVEISGYSEAELVGKNHRLLKSGAHPHAFYEDMWRTISAGKVWHGTLCNRRKNGQLYWVESTIVPFLDENGLPYQYVSLRTDVSGIMEVKARLRAERDFSDAAINAIPGTFYVLDAGGKVLRTNESTYRITGYSAEEIDRMDALAFFTKADQQIIAAAIRQGFEHGHVEVEASLSTRTGERIPFFFQAVRFDFEGTPALIGTGTDISALKRAQNALEYSEGRLRESQRYANIGTWDWNIQTGELYWSERIGPLFGYAEGKLETTYENFLAAVHPDDRQAVIDAVNACVERGEKYDIEHRAVWPDGTVRWLLERGDVVRDPQGAPLHMLGVVQDVTTLKETEHDLICAKEAAEHANQAKSDFLSSMSHELRTPMNAILGFAQLLEMDRSLSAVNHENVSEILKAGHHLLELINDVLDLAKVEAGRIDFALEAVACGALFADCIHLVEVMAQERGIALKVEARPYVVRADPTRLKQALVNLLSNAIKYNGPNGSVLLHAEEGDDGMVRIRVQDTGPGIALERQAQLFQPFNRLGAERTEVEGTGIGLVITRRLIEMMGGRIGIQSIPGEGSTFWLELPRAESALAPIAGQATVAGERASSNVVADTTVLYVEDNPANLRLVNQLFARRPHVRLLTAHTAALGLDLAVAQPPGLVLLDINLPGMDGYEMLRRLRALPGMEHVPIIAVTANAMPRDIERGLAAGFSDYLAKPLDITRFFEVVDALLAIPAAKKGGGA